MASFLFFWILHLNENPNNGTSTLVLVSYYRGVSFCFCAGLLPAFPSLLSIYQFLFKVALNLRCSITLSRQGSMGWPCVSCYLQGHLWCWLEWGVFCTTAGRLQFVRNFTARSYEWTTDRLQNTGPRILQFTAWPKVCGHSCEHFTLMWLLNVSFQNHWLDDSVIQSSVKASCKILDSLFYWSKSSNTTM